MGDSDKRMDPIIIVPVGAMRRGDIQTLRKNGICIVEAKDPSAVRFVEPPPLGYSVQEKAAIELFRYVGSHASTVTFTKQRLYEVLADFLVKGSKLEPVEKVAKSKP